MFFFIVLYRCMPTIVNFRFKNWQFLFSIFVSVHCQWMCWVHNWRHDWFRNVMSLIFCSSILSSVQHCISIVVHICSQWSQRNELHTGEWVHIDWEIVACVFFFFLFTHFFCFVFFSFIFIQHPWQCLVQFRLSIGLGYRSQFDSS